MRYENLKLEQTAQAAKDTVLSICQSGVLESTVIQPANPRARRPLLALHGISRNAAELLQAFTPAAEASGQVVVIPHFTADQWPTYQRVTKRARPDKAILASLETLRSMDNAFNGPIDIFGFSGGAQLAHRFAMLYPEVVGDLHLGAAGWYTFPQETSPYPYGVGDCPNRQDSWSRLMRSGLQRFLRRRISVYVGSNDTTRDASLRRNPQVDEQQGMNRLERARRYVASINHAQAALKLPVTAQLEILEGCDHSFSACAEQCGLALRVCENH